MYPTSMKPSNGAGRPSLAPSRVRSYFLRVRLDATELRAIKAAMRASGERSVSAYARKVLVPR